MNYEKLYRIIYNGVTDAIECMENEGGSLRAKEVLIRAQQAAEDYFIEAEDGVSPHESVYVLPHDVYGAPGSSRPAGGVNAGDGIGTERNYL